MLQENYANEVRRYRELEAEHGECVDKLHVSQEHAASHLKLTKEVQKEFDEFAEKVKDLQDKFTADTKEAIVEHIMRTRAEMMLEYKRGEWLSWDMDETIKEYNEKYPEKALPLNVAGEDESEHKSSKDGGQDEE